MDMSNLPVNFQNENFHLSDIETIFPLPKSKSIILKAEILC